MTSLPKFAPSGFASLHMKSLIVGLVVGIFIGGPKILVPEVEPVKQGDCTEVFEKCVVKYSKDIARLENDLSLAAEKACSEIIVNKKNKEVK